MKREVEEYVSQCLTCQQVKIEHQRPAGPLQSLKIPQWKWEYITIDFVTGLPRTPKGNNAIWVIVDRLTKLAHFLPYGTGLTLDGLAKLYVDEFIRLHGTPRNIVLDRDSKLTARFWQSFQKAMGSELSFSSVPSAERRAVGNNHPDTRRYAEKMRPRLKRFLGEPSVFD